MPELSPAFVSQWQTDAHIQYQQGESVLKSLVRAPDRVNAETVYWTVAAPGTAQPMPTLGQDAIPMNAAVSTVSAAIEDWQASEWIKAADEEKITHNQRMVTLTNISGALNRRIDEVIVSALDAGTYTSANMLGDASTAPSRNTFLSARKLLMSTGYRGFSPNVVCLVGENDWAYLHTVTEFNDAQKVGDDLPLPKWVDARVWLGVLFVWHPGLSEASSYRKCYMFHRNAVGLAETHAQTGASITYVEQKMQMWAGDRIGLASKIIDNTGVIQIRLDADIALP